MKINDYHKGFMLGRYKYDMETGKVTNLLTSSEVGSIDNRGYVRIGVTIPGSKQALYRAHHIAYLLMTGDWVPEGYQIDHINRDRADNRWSNLRVVSAKLNRYNRSDVADVCPYAVVSWEQSVKRWKVFIGKEAVDIYTKRGFIGTYGSEVEALEVVDSLLKD